MCRNSFASHRLMRGALSLCSCFRASDPALKARGLLTAPCRELHLVELNPYPQTFGSFLTWYYTLDGTTIDTDIVKHVTLDIGGGQFHTCTVSIEHQAESRPRLRMEAAFLDEGTIAIA